MLAEAANPTHRECYRDELNFAEFPLASLSTSLPKGQKTLEFTDEIFDKGKGGQVTRKLTITASDKYGLPTALDDEVLLGLIQLTTKAECGDRRVFFTRYELLKLLNWTDDTRNYSRISESLNRWLGVTLYYDKAWWSKAEQSWVSEGFHVLEQLTVLDNERRRKRVKDGQLDGRSSFVWNEVVFNSFRVGYLKQLDFEFYKQLESAIAKRMYRFLDKRFYHRQRLEFDLRTFACEHIGLGKNYHTGELKRLLGPAIAELETHGFLQSLSSELRFIRRRRGEWTVVFVRASNVSTRRIEQEPELVTALVERGVGLAAARKLVALVAETTVREKIALFDWLVAGKDSRVERNPAGFLYRSIAEDFPLPKDYAATVTPPVVKTRARSVPLQRQKASPLQEQSSDRDAIDRFWNALEIEEQARVERDLVANAPRFLRDAYREGEVERGLLFQTVRQALIDGYARQRMANPTEKTCDAHAIPPTAT